MPSTRNEPLNDTVEALVLDLLEWIETRERTYEEVMEVWRTSCPRLPVWEDAKDRRLVVAEHIGGRSVVRLSSPGLELLERHRPNRNPRPAGAHKSR